MSSDNSMVAALLLNTVRHSCSIFSYEKYERAEFIDTFEDSIFILCALLGDGESVCATPFAHCTDFTYILFIGNSKIKLNPCEKFFSQKIFMRSLLRNIKAAQPFCPDGVD